MSVIRLRGFVCGWAVALSAVACGGAKTAPPAAATSALVAPLPPPAPAAPLTSVLTAQSEEAALIPVRPHDARRGSLAAPVTIVMFGDLQGPYTAQAALIVKRVCDTHGPNQVRLVWKNHPFPFHHDARAAAEAAMAVLALKGSDAFWFFHDRALANQLGLTAENFAAWASEAGVDAARFKDALEKNTFAAQIDQDLADAAAAGATNDPSFRINGFTIDGAQPIEKFQEIIGPELIRARAALASGTRQQDLYATLTKKNHADELAQRALMQRTQEEDKTRVWALPIAADDPKLGAADALVTLVEFGDFQCPFCKRARGTLKQLAKIYGRDLRLVWLDNPIRAHERAWPAATLARLAYTQQGDRGFWAAHDRLFASSPVLDDPELQDIAQGLGLSWPVVREAIEEARFMDKIGASIELARGFDAMGTPTFFVNGVRLIGEQPIEKFRALIDAQLVKARALIAGGVPRAHVYDEIIKTGAERSALAPPL